MLLRPYQRQAIDAAYAFLRSQTGSPLLVLPTGAGKSPVLTTICKEAVEQWGGRVLVLTHVKELIQQLSETIHRVWDGPLGRAPVGIYSAGLGKRQTNESVIIAGIQSVYKRGTELGRFDIVLIDEAHLVPKDGEGMYLSLLSDLRVINPNLRLIGLTATPYRLDCGWLYGDGSLFTGVAYEASVRDLIDQGWLSLLRGKDGGSPDLTGVHKRGGEYIAEELEAEMSDPEKVAHACAEMVKHGEGRKAWLVFCCGAKHAGMVADCLATHDICSHVITGETPAFERAEVIRAFKERKLKCLVNVNVLTTGFDAPHVDLVALLRPTCSPGLYYQMVGRGLRKADGKADCLILDLGGNIARHGPIDNIEVRTKDGAAKGEGEAPVKTCPQCQEVLPLAAVVCNACGLEFPKPIARHEHTAASAAPLTVYAEEWVDVTEVAWSVHTKRDALPSTPKTLRVSYSYGYRLQVSEWVCVEHAGFARGKAEAWWHDRTGLPGHMCPTTAVHAMEALDLMQAAKSLRMPKRVQLRLGGKWPEILSYELGEAETAAVDANEPAYASLGTLASEDDAPPF